MGFLSRFERNAENAIDAMTDRFSNAPVSPAAIAKRCEKRMHADRMVGAGKQYAPTLYTVLVNPQDDRAMMGYYLTLSGELETHMKGAASEAGLVMDGQPLVRFIADSSLRPGKFEVIAETVTSPIVEQLRDDELQRYGITRGRYEAELARKQSMQREQAREARRSEGRSRGERPQRAGRRMQEEPADRGGLFGFFKGRNAAEDDYDAYDEEPELPEMPPVPGQNRYGLPTRPSGKRPLPYVPEEEIDRSVDYGEYTFNSLNFDDYDENGEPLAAEPAFEEEPFEDAGVPAPAFDEEPKAAVTTDDAFEEPGFDEPVFDDFAEDEPAAPAAPVMPPAQGRPSRPLPPQGYPQGQARMQGQPQGRPSRPFPAQGYPQGNPQAQAQAQAQARMQGRPAQAQPQGQPSRPMPPQGYPQGQGRPLPSRDPRMQGQPGMPPMQGRPSRPFPPQGQVPAGAQSIPLRSQQQQRAAAQMRPQQQPPVQAAPAAKPAAAPEVLAPAVPAAPAAPERPVRNLNVPTPAAPAVAAPAAPVASAVPAQAAAAAARPQRPTGVREPEVSYREPVSFTPASRIAPEAAAMPAAPVPGVLDRPEPERPLSATFAPETPAPAPKTMPYTDVKPPAPRYRIRNMQDGRSYTLTGTRVYIGRETTCNIVVNDANASRRHAELRSNGRGVWTINDLDSTNGTFLNGEAITSSPLADGDRITVGMTDLVFVVC